MSTATDPGGPTLWVEVAYGTPQKQAIVRIEVPAGCTVAEAIDRSGIRGQFPGMQVDPRALGVFSRKVPPDHVLGDGDRVEIYRPLIADPKEARRRRADAPSKPRT
jgi:putative ubiquitin-RnfH superfamily antitoxin RatB of RatAB toxin-antitoxin module